MRHEVEEQRNRVCGAWRRHDRVASRDGPSRSGIRHIERDELTGLKRALPRVDQTEIDLPNVVRELPYTDDLGREVMNRRHVPRISTKRIIVSGVVLLRA